MIQSSCTVVVNSASTSNEKEYAEAISNAISASNRDCLLIHPQVKRDDVFWNDLKEYCSSFIHNLGQDCTPILGLIGALNYQDGTVNLDINGPHPIKQMFPLFEIMMYPVAVFSAALHEYIPSFKKDDERNLNQYIFSQMSEHIENIRDVSDISYARIKQKTDGYVSACMNEKRCGYSLYGQFGMDFDGLADWAENHEVKCALILCDSINYVKHFGEIAGVDELGALKPIVEKNTETDVKNMMELYKKAHSAASSIYSIVRGALNGGLRARRRANNQCQYCGAEFKNGLFGAKCSSCKTKKDY